MDYQTEWLKVWTFLGNARNVLLCCHEGIDDDALSSVLATALFLEHLEKHFEFVYCDKLPDRVSLIKRDFDLKNVVKQPQDVHDIDHIIVLDTGEMRLLGKVQDLLHHLEVNGVPVLNIDHHVGNKLYSGLNIIDPEAAATCEVLYCLFRESSVRISEDMAHALLWGILSDTINLKTSSVTPRTLRVAADLIELGADRRALMEKMPTVANAPLASIWGHVLSSMEITGKDKNIVYAVVDDKTAKSAGSDSDLGGLASFMRDIGGVDVAVLFTQRDKGEIKVSLRSKPTVDVSQIASSLGGGGHHSASAFVIKGRSLDESIDLVIKTIKDTVERLREASPHT